VPQPANQPGRKAKVGRWTGFLKAGTLCLLLLSSFAGKAQFPVNQSFTGAPGSATNFTLGGNAILTGTSTTPGYLRLTEAIANQAGYAIFNNSFASPQGFSISFEFFSYGGTNPGADGFSVFLIDAAGTNPAVAGEFNIGAPGGSLGYAQKTVAGGNATDIPGVSKGYLGIGIDEFGNYPNPTEGRIGGPGPVAQNVTLRGPGTGLANYQFLTSSGALPFAVDVATVRAQPGSADYRKAFVYVVAANGAYNVTVRIQHGNTIRTTTDSYPITTPPANLRIGFAGSTGGSTNIHEIRNLAIVSNPVAVNDLVGTNYNTPLTFSVVANDKAFGTTLNNSTVDLDPTTPAQETSFTVTGQGTFTVDANGVVTFTPVNGFAGTVTIPYTVNDLLGQMSNPGKITVVVKGADVATNVSGPASANPGSQITYTVNTTNIGSLTATNISPTLQLPAGLTIPASANYTYNSASGLVTFSQTTLAQNASVINSITFTVPVSGTTSIVATSGYTYPVGAVVADPVANNNTSTLTTTVTGPATIATACATPGKDGPGSLTSASSPNTYYPGVSISTANGASTITVGTPSGTTPVEAGDLVLVMQMQGATINTTADNVNYGTVASSTAGQYEYAKVASVSGSPITTIALTTALGNAYTTSATANQNFQVVRVPQYSSLAVNGKVTGTAWNSQTRIGGVLALDVAGSTTFSGTTPGLDMTARGFSGGGGKSYVGTVGASNTPAVYASMAAVAHGSKGEGIAGTPRYFYNGSVVTDNTAEGYATGSNNIGAPANGGGGAQDFNPATNSGNAGGGGGGNASAGGTGGFGSGSGANGSGAKASGGRGVVVSATKIIMGGGGGAGSTNETAALAMNSSGGVGGGIVILRTGVISGAATIQANGSNAPSTAATALTQGGGGGGAGGTILVLATPATGTSALTALTASAVGGDGGTVNSDVSNGTSYGPGGGGSSGVIYASSAFSAVTLTVGANGTTTDGKTQPKPDAYGATPGAAGSTNTTTQPTNTTTIGGASSCLPMLSVALSTATPNVTRDNGTPRPASYTAIVSNTGGSAQASSTTLTLDPLFTYVTAQIPTVILTAADGTVTKPNSTLTGAGTSTPVFSGITIPSGSTLRIDFSAAIAATAVNGTVYQASGNVTFTDPTRTATSATTTTPGATFASGGGTVPGTNYAAASSTLENVTIVAPLPVELTRFEAVAQRQDAVLTWSTASEKNNDYFVVERSVSGRNFTAIGTVRGQGNSTRPTDYRFTDAGAGRLVSGKVYYRLQQVDADGTLTYGPVRAVEFAASTKATAALYPNPSQNEATIDLSGLADGTYTVTVLDLAGRVLRTQHLGALASPLDLKGLPQGAYVVLVRGVGISQALPLIRN
jgi:hypothetical protein